MGKVTVKIKNIYGVNKTYPVCDKARMFAKIAGTTTLTDSTMILINQLGFTINVDAPKAFWNEALKNSSAS